MREAKLKPRLYPLRRRVVWAIRWRHCRGFGLQSPWAYRFVCDVVNVRLPYYAYEPLSQAHAALPDIAHKLGRLYFRLANFARPAAIVDYGAPTAAYADYMQAGCRIARVASIGPSDDAGSIARQLQTLPAVGMARFTAAEGAPDAMAEVLQRAAEGALIVVEGIGYSSRARKVWRMVKADARVSITFDLYYCGVALVDSKRNKQNHIVNF